MIKLEDLFRDNHVSCESYGKHTTENHVNVHCPFCGINDPSFHMGISIDNGAYHCWRDTRHAGYNLYYLLMKLLKISKQQAEFLISKYSDTTPITSRKKEESKLWDYMDTFEDAEKFRAASSFLKKRGFVDTSVVCRYFCLKYSAIGEFSGRLIIPIYDQFMDLVSFTGRDVSGCSDIRYKTLSSAYSKKNIKDLLFNVNRRQSRDLVLVEGPIDAMLLEYLVPIVSSWALMGLDLSLGKIDNIRTNISGYENIYILLDNDQQKIKSISMAYELSCYTSRKVETLFLPDGYKDLGEMGVWEIPNWFFKTISQKKGEV